MVLYDKGENSITIESSGLVIEGEAKGIGLSDNQDFELRLNPKEAKELFEKLKKFYSDK